MEAKFRTGLHNGKIVWCNAKQLERYNAYNLNIPVFIILGIGETPGYPELFPSVAEKFESEVDEAVSSNLLWARQVLLGSAKGLSLKRCLIFIL